MDRDVIIIGGGASGLACAVRLIKSGKTINTAVIESGERFGKKLASTGNGQGNISNLDMTAAHFHGGNVELVQKIACRDAYDGSRLFDCLFTADERGRIYPAGRQASALTDNLLAVLKKSDAALFSGCTVKKIQRADGGFKVLYTDKDGGTAEMTSKFVVLATGGYAQPVCKTVSPYALAEDLGQAVTPLFPSLVQLKTDTKYIKTLKGIRADCKVTAYAGGQVLKSERGDVIFTEYGVSGSAVFAISECVTDRKDVTLSLEFLPDVPADAIAENIAKRRKAGCSAAELLSGTLHNQIGRAIISRAGDEIDKIVKTLKNFNLPVAGTTGFAYAQVTRGGVDMRGVTDELESVIAKNFFMIGEVLDVDGDCGGYNLQWAFTSGMAAADAVIKRI